MSNSRCEDDCHDLQRPTRRSMGSLQTVRAPIAAFILLTSAESALAQTQAGASAEGTDQFRTIIVTARKQEEPAISTPVSVSLFDAGEIQKHQADSLEPLARLAPNVSYESGANIAGGGRTYTAFMRGIGQNDFLLTIDPGVGLYVDGVYVPAKGFEFRSALGYIDPKYLRVSPAAFPVSLASRLPNASRWTLSVAANATLIQRGDFVVSAQTDWAYKSSHFKDANNSPQLFQPGYGLLNANLAIDLPGPQLNLAIGATNIGNVAYLVSGYSELAIQAAAYGVFGPPRRIYARLQKRL